jgi:hypothetical protein
MHYYIILGDKNFIFAEYSQLNKMAEDNLKLREVQSRKRRRMSTEISRKDIVEEDSLSTWSGVSQNINQDRVISPSPHLQSKKVMSYERTYPSIMTYDQGTQTDEKMTCGGGFSPASLIDKLKELQNISDVNEYILNEQKTIKNDTKVNRYLLESFVEEFANIRKSMQALEGKIDTLNYERTQYEALQPQEANAVDKKMVSTKILNGSESAQPFYIIETPVQEQETSLTTSNVEYTVEELEADDSGRSTSRISYHDQASMMSNASMDVLNIKKENLFRRSHSSSNFSICSSTPIARSNSSSNLADEWNDVEGDVQIGTNQTTVAAHVLRSIDWKNYKAATRKLLVSLFPRAILASRSLTGRPSPAFHDRSKPVKEKLDQNIINDIIQIITRKCGVHESQVRTAITTKCADENKMMRSREGKNKFEANVEEKFKAPSLNVNDDKENMHDN